MYVASNPQTVGDFVDTLRAGAVRINRDYQRGGGIWPPAAKSALIETIILKYPMPAIYLHQRFDKDTRKAYREVVDGQQRSDAIIAFSEGKLRLSKSLPTVRLRGKKFAQLEDDDQFAFLTYSLPVFLFTDTTETEVREAFRRINSHTSVLNGEEKRHSTYQGPLKWFVVALTKDLQTPLVEWGVFNRSQLTRMRDAWLVSEVLYALEHGLQTTKAEHLDQLYAEHDVETEEFPFGDTAREDILDALSVFGRWEWLPSSPFTKPYHFMVLLLAVMHAKKGIPSLEPLAPGGRGILSPEEVAENMAELVRALDNAEAIQEFGASVAAGDIPRIAPAEAEPATIPSESSTGREDVQEPDDSERAGPEFVDARLMAHAPFVHASSGKTNTAESRRERFRSYHRAISS